MTETVVLQQRLELESQMISQKIAWVFLVAPQR